MKPNEAFAVMARLVAEHGTRAGIGMVAEMAGVGWHTAYGWWRRGNVPDWRVAAFDKAAPPSSRPRRPSRVAA